MHVPRERSRRPLTVSEFEALPEEDAYRVELVRGQLVRSPRPASLHGRIVIRLGRRLDEYAEAGGHGVVLADAGVILSRHPDTVRGPDIAFFSPDRIPEGAYGTTFWGPPDLAVEIVSPSNRVSELQEKLADYLDAGMRRVWVVDPATRSVTVWAPTGEARVVREGGTLEGDDVLPGFRLEVSALFSV
jgi:Uma2 family endonuclease